MSPRGRLLLVGLLAAVGLSAALEERPPIPEDRLPRPLPGEVPLGLDPAPIDELAADEALVELGRRLFFDPLLSLDRSIACASCHRPELGFADDVPFSSGVAGELTERNTPTVLNRVYGQAFMWRGESSTLEEQVLKPIANPREMALPLAQAVVRLRESQAYRERFERACGTAPDEEQLARALAAFVRRLWAGDSPFDRFRAGERDALTPEQRGGMWLFQSRGQCWRCHVGRNLSDESFHNTGVESERGVPAEGRFAISGEEAERGAFKTPTLRAIALTAPYMHDGSLATLGEVVQFYREGGRPNSHLDADIAPIELTDAEAANLVAFLRALTPARPASSR